jgi:hypothetical protein
LRVNGFDEGMQYGGLDRELGERLENIGICGLQVRHRIACVHLDHPRSYETSEGWQKNNAIRTQTAREQRVWTPRGIRKHEAPPSLPDAVAACNRIDLSVTAQRPWNMIQRALLAGGRLLGRFPST